MQSPRENLSEFPLVAAFDTLQREGNERLLIRELWASLKASLPP